MSQRKENGGKKGEGSERLAVRDGSCQGDERQRGNNQREEHPRKGGIEKGRECNMRKEPSRAGQEKARKKSAIAHSKMLRGR